MRPLYGFAWGWALALLAVSSSPAWAGWNNVFQVCCNHCGSSTPAPVVAASPVVVGYGSCDPCPAPCPQTTCTTKYVQRSFYTPVTTYRTSYYMEPVTTYRTSYYYEPVTSYRYSCYYDPCTCSYQTVATPQTSYRLRSRCCPVTSYLQRTCMTPVTTYQQSFYYEPVTTCCTTSVGGAVTTPPPGAAVVPNTAESTTPGTNGSMPPPPPGTTESTTPMTSDPYKSERSPSLPSTPRMPSASDEGTIGSLNRRPPAIRIDRMASREGYNLQGQVVLGDRTPRSGAKLLLVSVESKTNQRTITTERDGSFQANVPAGGWLVYTHDEQGRPVFSRRIEVPADKLFTLTVTQR